MNSDAVGLGPILMKKIYRPGWRRGIVVIASAFRIEALGFESCQGVWFLGIYTFQCCCQNLQYIHCHCVYLKDERFKN
jgi:hypothetical protein